MNSTNAMQLSFMNEREKFLSILSSFIILDIGTIEQLKENGRARVVSSTFINNRPVIYENAELIFPGNANGCYGANGMNMACLIFIPRSCMPSVDNLVLRMGKPSYDKDGVKAMPIGNGTANNIKTYFGDGGDYSITGKSYSCIFRNNDIVFQTDDGQTELAIDGTGQLYVTRQSDKGAYSISIEDTGITKQWVSENQDVIWTDTLNPDGSRSFQQADDQDNVLFSITIAADGTASLGLSKGLTVETEDELVLKGKSVSIESTDGNVSVTAAGKASIESSDDTTVSTGENKKFLVNGTNLEVE